MRFLDNRAISASCTGGSSKGALNFYGGNGKLLAKKN
jgi:hypothetical protein